MFHHPLAHCEILYIFEMDLFGTILAIKPLTYNYEL